MIEAYITSDKTLREALQIIENSGAMLVVVVDLNRKVIGTLSDGDVRRALLSGQSLDSAIENAMTKNPHLITEGLSRALILSTMAKLRVHQLPVVDKNGLFKGLEFFDSYHFTGVVENPVVIMCGGLGSRLGKLTKKCPKPMLKLGGKPLLEIILEKFIDQGFQNFYFSINYLGELIQFHFGDGSSYGVNIHYLKEDDSLGTAGSLALLRDYLDTETDIVVTNADLIMDIDYREIIKKQEASGSIATSVVSPYRNRLAFGVVDELGGVIREIKEKPSFEYLISSGVNILSSQIVKNMSQASYIDMPDLINDQIQSGRKVSSYFFDGFWLDIGNPDDFNSAQQLFDN